MADLELRGVSVKFPFQPYKVQEDYMKKVIECLQEAKHGVLESPTGTGKTLCLLCSSLSWLSVKKAQIQAQTALGEFTRMNKEESKLEVDDIMMRLHKVGGEEITIPRNTFGWSMPKIIYASRTHSQLSQVMQELKRTSYNHMKVTVLGSRDQLCIHPEVSKEPNSSNKIHMCQAKIKARTCFYYNNVEIRKDDPTFRDNIMDIEDLVKAGNKLKCCPYFLTRELKQNADIIFMPYNYLLDPKTRKSQGIELSNNIVLLDEAHNIEKTCEEAASLQISSTDIAVCIDEITAVMKDMASEENHQQDFNFDSQNSPQKDFTAEDLCILKTMFLEFEKVIDSIEIKKKDEGQTYPGGYVFDLLAKVEITPGKDQLVIDKLEKIITYLTTTSTSPFNKKGKGLQKFCDFLRVVFVGGSGTDRYREKIKQCYKVYVQMEEQKKVYKNDAWETKKFTKFDGKLISYWCFSPGFGMQQLVDQGVRSVILTSGTLSPLQPFISELAIPISVQLENPHIVTSDQVCVGVLSNGPDGHPLNSSFNTRNDPKYISSLGQTILNFSCLLPHGLLVFFPSYPIMKKCREFWQDSGVWTKISDRKPIFVEPQSKDTFISVMNEYYQKIQDPSGRGAIFMAVCRGKVSEGLDFANANGRAVLITGLPFPPLKDPRVILKQRYLDENRKIGNEGLTGQMWYQLEASRAVNQAIGRIIRHKNDYGAIILCDCRFENPSFKQHLSAWIRPQIKKFINFGIITRELRLFFKKTEENFPQASSKQKLYLKSDYSSFTVNAAFDTSTTKLTNIVNSKEGNSNYIQKRNDYQFGVDKYPDRNNKILNHSSASNIITNPITTVKSATAINFSNCKLDNSDDLLNQLGADSRINEPLLKKRKIKVQTIKFLVDNTESQGSTSSISTQFPPTHAIKSEQSCNKSYSEPCQSSANIKVELGKNYLREVKKSLNEADYKMFSTMTANYTKNGDFEELYRNLELLFLFKSLKELFVGFRTFLKKDHKTIFDSKVDEITRLNMW